MRASRSLTPTSARDPARGGLALRAFDDTVERCREMVDWVEKDLERGAIGGEPVEEAR